MPVHRNNCFTLCIADCLPYVAEKGSVGASGDLAPLSHLILGLMGQGQMWSPKTGWGPAATVRNSDNKCSFKINNCNRFYRQITESQSH